MPPACHHPAFEDLLVPRIVGSFEVGPAERPDSLRLDHALRLEPRVMMNVAGETEEIAGGQSVCRRGRLVEAVADANVHRPSADDHDAFVGPVKVGLNLVSSRELRAGYEEAPLARTPLERG